MSPEWPFGSAIVVTTLTNGVVGTYVLEAVFGELGSEVVGMYNDTLAL
jgi:hypothetical protein